MYESSENTQDFPDILLSQLKTYSGAKDDPIKLKHFNMLRIPHIAVIQLNKVAS
jgi:hypothetical protein